MKITQQDLLNSLLLQEKLLTDGNTRRAQQKARAHFAVVTGNVEDFQKQLEYFDKVYSLDREASPLFTLNEVLEPRAVYTFINFFLDDPEVLVVLSAEEISSTDSEWKEYLERFVENTLLRRLKGMTESAEISLCLSELVD